MVLGLLAGALIVASLAGILVIALGAIGLIITALRRPDPQVLLRQELDRFLYDLLGTPPSRV